MSKPALGRGLGALLGGASPTASPRPAGPVTAPSPGTQPPRGVREVALDEIVPSPLQPRKEFPPEALQELCDSIREQGIVQPLIVRPAGGRLELIAGERRWRAARQAGLTRVPVVERAATDREVLELALIENLQRENLSPLEEARGYQQLQAQFDLTQEDVARKVGRSRVAVANALRLLRLPDPVQSLIGSGRLGVGHAKVILGLAEPDRQQAAADEVVAGDLSVRQTEELVARWNAPRPATAPPAGVAPQTPRRDPHVADLENRLRERLASRVALRYRAGKGSLEIRFASDDELNRLLDLLGVRVD